MAGPKKPASKTAAAKPSKAKKGPAKTIALQKRAARDPYRGPSSKRIAQSLDKGTTVTLESFRKIIDWS